MFLSPQDIMISAFCDLLQEKYIEDYGKTDIPYGKIATWAARLALENISNSDMLYHNIQHTIMVTSAGQTILHGKHLIEGGITPEVWFHCTMGMLFHDIGYCKGICHEDHDNTFVIDKTGKSISLPEGTTDATLAPYHVDRSQIFIRDRFGDHRSIRHIDAERINTYIEMTRFPVPADEDDPAQNPLGLVVRAADMVGQLGDPNYFSKIPALFYEFEQVGWNKSFGYKRPFDLITHYDQFYWQHANPHIEPVLPYLRATSEGRQWIANLYSHIFHAEHNCAPDLPE